MGHLLSHSHLPIDIANIWLVIGVIDEVTFLIVIGLDNRYLLESALEYDSEIVWVYFDKFFRFFPALNPYHAYSG